MQEQRQAEGKGRGRQRARGEAGRGPGSAFGIANGKGSSRWEEGRDQVHKAKNKGTKGGSMGLDTPVSDGQVGKQRKQMARTST
jgi:hypothetical protein